MKGTAKCPIVRKDPSQVIDKLYNAAIDPSLWSSALREIREHTPTEGIVLTCCDVSDIDKERPTFLVDLDPHGWDLYCKDYVGMCPRIRFASANRPNYVFYDYAHTQENEIRSSSYYELVRKEWGTRYYMGAMFEISGNLQGHLGVHRTKKVGHPQQEDIQLMEVLRPHILRALQLTYNVTFSTFPNTLRNNLIPGSAHGTVVLNNRASMIYADESALSFLNQNDGLFSHEGQIRARYSYDDNRLIQNLRSVVSKQALGSGNAMRITRPSKKIPYQLMICRAPDLAGFGLFGASAIIFISDPAQKSALDPAYLEQLFGLTPKEAELLYQITRFTSLEKASEEMGITKHTARVHLKSVFYKTGTNSQPEVIKLALSH